MPPRNYADAFGNVEPGLRPVELEKIVDAVTARSDRSPGQRKSTVPRAREKARGDRTEIRHRCSPRAREGPSGPTDVREFGKLVPYVRNKGCLLATSRSQRLGRSDCLVTT